jgi:hypothetical protein
VGPLEEAGPGPVIETSALLQTHLSVFLSRDKQVHLLKHVQSCPEAVSYTS